MSLVAGKGLLPGSLALSFAPEAAGFRDTRDTSLRDSSELPGLLTFPWGTSQLLLSNVVALQPENDPTRAREAQWGLPALPRCTFWEEFYASVKAVATAAQKPWQWDQGGEK